MRIGVLVWFEGTGEESDGDERTDEDEEEEDGTRSGRESGNEPTSSPRCWYKCLISMPMSNAKDSVKDANGSQSANGLTDTSITDDAGTAGGMVKWRKKARRATW